MKEKLPTMNNDELSFYANISANYKKKKKMMMDMQLFSFDFGNIDNLKNNLNTIYKKIDDKYKNLPKIIKISLLERIMFFAISKINNDFANNSNLKNDNIEFRKIVALSTSLSKQIIDIKKYDLSVIIS